MSMESLDFSPNLDVEVQAIEPSKQVVIDWDRVDEVLNPLLDAYINNKFPFNQDNVRLPHDPRHMPKTLVRGTTDHAMFLWSSCYYMRGGIKSNDAFKALARIYDDQPHLFNTSVALQQDPEAMSQLLKSYGLGYQHRQIGRIWVENAARMETHFDGDPRNIFSGRRSYEELLPLIMNKNGKGFLGFQKKMVSMATYYLMDEDLIEPFIFPLPVDLHVMRVSVANEMIKFPGYLENENVLSDYALDVVRTLYYNYAKNHHINPLRLCDAVWLISQSLCGKQPGNITLEPNGRHNRNGRKTLLVPLEVDLNSRSQQQAYHRSCESCPLEETCVWNVPSKSYYVQGELIRRGQRLKFPSSFLFKMADYQSGDDLTTRDIYASPEMLEE